MYQAQKINLASPRSVVEVRSWLAQQVQLNYGADADSTFVIRSGDEIIATASRSANVFKYFGIHPDHQGENLSAILIGALIDDAFSQGIYHYFIYTSPQHMALFEASGFHPVIQNQYAALLEGGETTIREYMEELKAGLSPPRGERGAIVMNLNPMTRGHLFLIEEALGRVEELIIFIVEEDLSVFPFADRLAIAREATQHLPGVRVLAGGPYMISRATFPTYFLKQADENLAAYTATDAGIFARYYARALGITSRFAGEEPLDPVTAAYNDALARELKTQDIRFEIIPRKTQNGGVISASRVRAHLARGEMEEALALVTDATRRYLATDKGRQIIARLKEKEANRQ